MISETKKTYNVLRMLGIPREIKDAVETKGLFDATDVGDFDDEFPDEAKRLSEGLENLVESTIKDVDKALAAVNLAYDLQQKGISQISLSATECKDGTCVELCTNIRYIARVMVPNVNGMLPKVQRRLDRFRTKYNSGKYTPKAIRIA